MSLARALTKRVKAQDASKDKEKDAVLHPQAAAVAASNAAATAALSRGPGSVRRTRPVDRSQISLPVELLSSTNVLAFEAPDLFPNAAVAATSAAGNSTPLSPASSSVSTRSADNESEASGPSSASSVTTAVTTPDMSRECSPAVGTVEPNHLSVYFANSAASSQKNAPEVPAGPTRSKTLASKRSHGVLTRKRSQSQVREAATAPPLDRSNTVVAAAPPTPVAPSTPTVSAPQPSNTASHAKSSSYSRSRSQNQKVLPSSLLRTPTAPSVRASVDIFSAADPDATPKPGPISKSSPNLSSSPTTVIAPRAAPSSTSPAPAAKQPTHSHTRTRSGEQAPPPSPLPPSNTPKTAATSTSETSKMLPPAPAAPSTPIPAKPAHHRRHKSKPSLSASHGKPPPAEEAHPFGAEIAQVKAVAAEFGVRVVDAEEEQFLSAHGLLRFSADAYISEIAPCYKVAFGPESQAPSTWI